jgi:hypothetical protein
MIPNHKQFIEAIHARNQVCIRFYSRADSGLTDLVCAPLDYGAVDEVHDGVNRYQFWDYSSNNGSHTLVLGPEQIQDLRVLGTAFDPAEFGVQPQGWKIPREWVVPLEKAGGGLCGPPITIK